MKANAANVLSQMTGVSPKDLQQQAENMVASAPAGKVIALSSLDAALAASAAGKSGSTERSFTALTQTRANEVHNIEAADQAFQRVAVAPGFSERATSSSKPLTQAVLASLGQAAADRMKATPMMQAKGLMDGSVGVAFQDAINEAEGTIRDFEANKGSMDADSRQLQFEKVKQQMQQITRMINMMTNVLKMMNDGAMSAVRNIRA